MRLAFMFILVATLVMWEVNGLSCPPCKPEDCNPNVSCQWGVGKDVCGCCDECFRGPGEKCGGPWNIEGRCGEGLDCFKDPTKHPEYILDQVEGECRSTEGKPLSFSTA